MLKEKKLTFSWGQASLKGRMTGFCSGRSQGSGKLNVTHRDGSPSGRVRILTLELGPLPLRHPLQPASPGLSVFPLYTLFLTVCFYHIFFFLVITEISENVK